MANLLTSQLPLISNQSLPLQDFRDYTLPTTEFPHDLDAILSPDLRNTELNHLSGLILFFKGFLSLYPQLAEAASDQRISSPSHLFWIDISDFLNNPRIPEEIDKFLTIYYDTKGENTYSQICAILDYQLPKKVPWQSQQVSYRINTSIPKVLAKIYLEEYEEWWYLNREKGEYITCSYCGNTKLNTTKYYNKTGAKNKICKSCKK